MLSSGLLYEAGAGAAALPPGGSFLESWLPWLSAVGVIFTLVALAAAAAAYFRATAAKATIEIQGATILALQQRLDQVLTENTRVVTENTRILSDNTVLRDALSGKADIERVETLIDTHHRQVMEDRNLDRVTHEARFDHIDRALSDIKGILHDRRVQTGTA